MFASSLHYRPPILKQRPFLILTAMLTIVIISLLTINAPNNQSNLLNNDHIQQMQLPITFVPNLGQTAPAVQFQAHDLGGTLYFSENEVVLSLPDIESDLDHSIRFQFVGTEPDIKIHEGSTLPGVVNYLIGNQQSEWLTDLPTYGEIVYESIYPGIDLSYDGANGRLKGTYLVAPGANPALIQWHHAGADSVTTDLAGNLVITLPNTNLTFFEEAPIAWQEVNGQKREVPVSYAVATNGTIGFTLGQYNSSLPLIIDPTIVYSVTLGGDNVELATSIAIDADGNSYITGSTGSDNYPSVTPYQTDQAGYDVFVTKINAAGTGIVYSTYIGGSQLDTGNSIAVDANGITYVVGNTDSTDFPTQNPVQSSNGGGTISSDAFVLALNANGNGLVYSTYLGGTGLDTADAVAIDSTGNVYVTGMTTSSDFPTNEAYDSTLDGLSDAFVTKLNSSGSAWVYSTYLGGNDKDLGSGIAVEGDNAYVIGSTFSNNFPTQNPYQASIKGASDVFVTKFNSAGDSLDFSTYLGGDDVDTGYGIAIHNGQAHTTGYTKSNNFPTQNAIQSAYGGGDEDGFVSTLTSTGNSLLFSSYLGGTERDEGRAITVNSTGDIYLVGETISADFPTANPLQAINMGQSDAFVTKISSFALAYSTYLGGSDADYGYGLAQDNAGNAYVLGHTDSSNFPGNSIGNSALGQTDLFVVKIADAGSSTIPPLPPGGNVNLSGSFKYASHFQIGPNDNLTYSIRLHNSGTVDTTADVSDEIPSQFELVTGTITENGIYDTGTNTITWDDVAVASGESVTLEFEVIHDVSKPVVVVNTAEITPAGKESFDRPIAVLLTTSDLPGDFIPPVVNDVIIGDEDILTNADTTLTIDATDNEAVTEMYIAEWQINSIPHPKWQKVQTSGWVPYQSTYAWTLGDESGVHYITVWVSDTEGNISLLTPKATDFASLLLPDETVSQHKAVPYLVQYNEGVNVTATLTPSAGDADLYIWYPNSFGQPDEMSINEETAVDSISFTTPSEGVYLFLVYGYEDSNYNLSIAPAGGPALLKASDNQPAAANMATNKEELTIEPILNVAGINPLGETITPSWPLSEQIYLPIISNN